MNPFTLTIALYFIASGVIGIVLSGNSSIPILCSLLQPITCTGSPNYLSLGYVGNIPTVAVLIFPYFMTYIAALVFLPFLYYPINYNIFAGLIPIGIGILIYVTGRRI